METIKNTALPVNSLQQGKLTADQKRQKYFDNYYTSVKSVDPAQFDIVLGFLKGRGFDETVQRNLAISILEIAKEQNINPLDLIEQLDQVKEAIQLNTLLCLILNTVRNRTSVIGFDKPKVLNNTIKRTILA